MFSVFNSGSNEQRAINTKRNQLSSNANIWQLAQRRQQQQAASKHTHTHTNNNNIIGRSNSSNNHKMLGAYSSKLKLKLKRISRHLTSLQVAYGDGQAQTSPKAFPEFQLLLPFCLCLCLCPYHCCCFRFRLPLVLVLDCLCFVLVFVFLFAGLAPLAATAAPVSMCIQYPFVREQPRQRQRHRLIPNGKCCLGKSTRSG